MLKALRSDDKLSEVEEKLYAELLTESGPVWVYPADGGVRQFTFSAIDIILDTRHSDLTSLQVRNALESMRDGTPTFMDQKITKELVDHLFTVYHAAQVEETTIGAPYV